MNPQTTNSIHASLHRNNLIKPLIQHVVVGLSSYPALLIELFTRKKFGQRYMSVASCVTAILAMFFFAILLQSTQRTFLSLFGIRSHGSYFGFSEILVLMFGLVAYFKAIQHKRERMKLGGTLDFNRYSRSWGIPCAYWHKLEKMLPTFLLKKIPFNNHNIRQYYEPFSAILIGLILIAFPFGRTLGMILFFCGILYYARTRIQFSWGRAYVLDHIDQVILNEELHKFWTGALEENDDMRGVMVTTPIPKTPEQKTTLAQHVLNDLTTGGFQLDQGANKHKP